MSCKKLFTYIVQKRALVQKRGVLLTPLLQTSFFPFEHAFNLGNERMNDEVAKECEYGT